MTTSVIHGNDMKHLSEWALSSRVFDPEALCHGNMKSAVHLCLEAALRFQLAVEKRHVWHESLWAVNRSQQKENISNINSNSKSCDLDFTSLWSYCLHTSSHFQSVFKSLVFILLCCSIFHFFKFLNVSRYQRPPAAAFTPAQGLFIFLIIYSHSWWLSHSLEASRHIIRPVGSSSTPPCTASPPSSASWWRYNAPSTAAAFFSTAFDLPLLLVCAAPNSARQACNPQHS